MALNRRVRAYAQRTLQMIAPSDPSIEIQLGEWLLPRRIGREAICQVRPSPSQAGRTLESSSGRIGV